MVQHKPQPCQQVNHGPGVNTASEFTMGLTAVKAVRRPSESFTQHKNNQELQIPSYHRQVKTFPWSQSSNSKLAKMEVTDGGESGSRLACWQTARAKMQTSCTWSSLSVSFRGSSLKHAGSHPGLLPLCWPGAAGSSPPVRDLQPEAQENQRRSHTCGVSICSALGAELHPCWKSLLPQAFIRCQRPFTPASSLVP